MLSLGNEFLSSRKTLVANAATTATKCAASAGKQNNAEVPDTSCHHLSKRDLAYFSSERFAKTLQFLENRQLAKEYGKLIASRKRVTNLNRAYEVVDAIIYVDIYNAHEDGFSWSYEEVRDLFKGYRSQALREVKSAEGFNLLVYRKLAKALNDKREVRSFMAAMNRPIVRKKVNL